MTPERERAMEYISEEMLPTMYDQEPPAKKLAAPLSSSAPAKVSAAATTPALGGLQHKPQATTTTESNRSNVAPRETLADKDNRRLYPILIAAAALFTLSIIVVAILYAMGKI